MRRSVSYKTATQHNRHVMLVLVTFLLLFHGLGQGVEATARAHAQAEHGVEVSGEALGDGACHT